MGDLSDIAGDRDVEVLIECAEAYSREGGSPENPLYGSEIQRQALRPHDVLYYRVNG